MITKQLAVAEFDGDAARLATGPHDIGPLIPKGAIVTGFWIRVIDAVTGQAGFTISLGAEAAGDIRSAVGTATWGTAGVKATTGTAPILLTASRRVSMVVAVGALLTGRFQCFVEYIPPAEGAVLEPAS